MKINYRNNQITSQTFTLPFSNIGIILVIALIGLGAFGQQLKTQETLLLRANQTVERVLKGNSAHSYNIALTAGQYLHIVVEQKRIDVTIALFDPKGKKLVEVNSLNEMQGPEPLSFIAERVGNYRLEVSSEKKTALGRYEVKIKELRSATGRDKNSIAAQQARGEGVLLIPTSRRTEESLRKAIKKFEEALRFYRAADDRDGEATMLSYIGVIYSALGERQIGLEYQNDALPLFKTVGNKSGEATANGYIGVIYYWLGDNPRALRYYTEALSLHKAIGDKRSQAKIITSIGLIYAGLKDNQKALGYYMQALPLSRIVGDEESQAATLNNIALAYFELRNNQKALDYFAEALLLNKATGHKVGEARTLNNIGRVYLRLGKKQQALDHHNQALPISRIVGDRHGQANILYRLQDVWSSLDNPSLAIFYGKQSVNKYQELRQLIRGLDKATQKTYLKTVEGIYRQLANLLIEQGRIAEAEQVLSMLKEEEYFDYIRRDDKVAKELLGKVSLTPTELEAFKRFEESADKITAYAKEYGELERESKNYEAGQFPKQTRLDELEKLVADANKVFSKFLAELNVKFKNTSTNQTDTRVEIVSYSQSLLKALNQPRTVSISTIIDEDRLNIIVTTSNVQRAHTVPIKESDLNKLVADFRQAIQNPAIDPRLLGKQLYDVLFPTALQKDLENIKTDTLIWSLDKTLRYVPVSALSPDGKQYLVERYANAVITLASRDNLKLTPTERNKWQALGAGVSKPFETFPALDAVPEELCSVVNDPQKKVRCEILAKNGKTGVITGKSLLDDEFTLQNFKNNLGRYSVVHIASHFSLNAGDENNSFLLLGGGPTSNERKLSLSTIRDEFKAKFNDVELLTLSACNTAMTGGVESNGKEVEGFGVTVQKQGAKTVLATLWAVNDPSTRDVMIEFYRTLEANKQISKAEALRLSQISLLNGKYKTEEAIIKRRSDLVILSGKNQTKSPFKEDKNAPFAHPYYWSPFVLIGNWR